MHSIGAALFARKDQIHFFNEIGYLHNPFMVRLFRRPTSPSEPNDCFSTALKVRFTRKESAGAIRKRASVSCFLAGNFFRAWCSWVCGDRSRVVLLSEQIRCAIQMIVFYFAEMGAIERTDWTICGPDWVKADGCDKPMD